jgi:hypothetical protein
MRCQNLNWIISIYLVPVVGCIVGHEADPDRPEHFNSPDGRKSIEVATRLEPTWPSSQYGVSLKHGDKVLFRTTIPPEKEARYVSVSWAPSSDAVLVAVNYKSVEDWILIRLTDGKASSVTFDGGKLVTRRMLDVLPFRDEIKSIAPVGRVPWNTVRWDNSKRCTMSFIYRGIGYEGTARLLIDFKSQKPTFSVRSIVPNVKERLWDQE